MNDAVGAAAEPRVFMSYASEPGHDEWVLRLAERLTSNGVHVIFDQWDVGLGANLAHFMEQGLVGSDRVVCVCSDAYVVKANAGEKGVGYEKKIISASMLTDANTAHVIPVLRNVEAVPPVPTFLSGTRYVDFRDDSSFDSRYRELVHDLYGVSIKRRPSLGMNPFATRSETLSELAIRFDRTAFESPALVGEATFRYQDNDGLFTFGTSPDLFQLHVTTAGPRAVYVYKDSSNIVAIGLAVGTSIESLKDPWTYDGSSRVRNARVGDSVVLTNREGRVAAVEIVSVTTRDTAEDGVPMLSIRYAVLTPTL